jgi:hypothetical protein
MQSHFSWCFSCTRRSTRTSVLGLPLQYLTRTPHIQAHSTLVLNQISSSKSPARLQPATRNSSTNYQPPAEHAQLSVLTLPPVFLMHSLPLRHVPNVHRAPQVKEVPHLPIPGVLSPEGAPSAENHPLQPSDPLPPLGRRHRPPLHLAGVRLDLTVPQQVIVHRKVPRCMHKEGVRECEE